MGMACLECLLHSRVKIKSGGGRADKMANGCIRSPSECGLLLRDMLGVGADQCLLIICQIKSWEMQPYSIGSGLGRPPQQATRCFQATRGAVGNGILEGEIVLGRPLQATRCFQATRGVVKNGLLEGKSIIRVATINVVTLSGKVNEVVDVMKERRIDVLGLSETKWKDGGKLELNGGYRLWWSGSKEAKRNGVGIIVSPKWKEEVLEVREEGDRIIKIRMKVKHEEWEICQIYAPQVGCDQEAKDQFEEQLEGMIGRRDIILLGDFNAQVGNERTGYEEVVGKYGYGRRNVEGERLLDLCNRNGLVIGNTWFQKRDSHRITRYSWNGEQKTQIDYVVVSKEKKKMLKDVKIIPSVGMDGDHRLLVADIQIEGTVRKRREYTEKKLKVWKLSEIPVREEYQQMIRKDFPRGETKGVEEEWGLFKRVLVQATEKTCGRTSGVRKEVVTSWWNDKVKEKVQAKNKAWREYMKNRTDEKKESYKNAKREAQRMVKEEKAEDWKKFAGKLEKDADGNKKMLYGIVKSKRKERGGQRYLTDDSERLITNAEEIKETWKQYFDQLLNVGADVEDREVELDERAEEEDENGPTWLEVEVALKKMKNGKAAGVDELVIEMVKAGGPVAIHWLYRVIRVVWKERKIPTDWEKGMIVPIYKKGDRKKCGNYRGITLLCHTLKIYERIIDRRMRLEVDNMLNEEQYGFRWGRSTIDPIFVLRQAMEKSWEFGKRMSMVFLDIEKAYDSVPRNVVWESLERKGVNRGLIERVKSMYNVCESCVKTQEGMSGWFHISQGLRQGSVLSPLLFIIVMDDIHNKVKAETEERMDVEVMLFADDFVAWSENEEVLQRYVSLWNRNIREAGMRISVMKSEVLTMPGERDGEQQAVEIKIGEDTLKVVESFSYLGSEVMASGKMKKEINNRIRKASNFYQCVKGLVWDREIPIQCKLTLYKTYFIPILTYAAETWTMGEREESQIQAAEMRFLRSMVGMTKRDRIRNTIIREMLGVEKLGDKMGRTRLRWYGHMKRMTEERMPRRIYEGSFEGSRRRGRPRKRWKESIARDLQARGESWEEVEESRMWEDKKKWRNMVARPKLTLPEAGNSDG